MSLQYVAEFDINDPQRNSDELLPAPIQPPAVRQVAVRDEEARPELRMVAVKTNLNEPPPNWLQEDSRIARVPPTNAPGKLLSQGTTDLVYCAGDSVDVLAPAEHLKTLFKMPHSSTPFSLAVHRIGKTLVLDDSPFPRPPDMGGRPRGEGLLPTPGQEGAGQQQMPSRAAGLKKKNQRKVAERKLFSKFLYYSAEPRPENEGQPQTEADEGVGSNLGPDDTDDATSTMGGATGRRRSESSQFRRVGKWAIDDVTVLLGSDLIIFRTNDHPAVSLRLHSVDDPVTVQDSLDMWLDNVFCNVPETAMCFHKDGIVQGYHLLKTSEMPTMTHPKENFKPRTILSNASALLKWLKESSSDNVGSYWLVRDGESSKLQLYDLTMETEIRDSEGADMRGASSEMYGAMAEPVASLCFHMASKLSKSMNTTDQADRQRIRRLLTRCLALLPREHSEGIRARASEMLADTFAFVDVHGSDTPNPHPIANPAANVQSVPLGHPSSPNNLTSLNTPPRTSTAMPELRIFPVEGQNGAPGGRSGRKKKKKGGSNKSMDVVLLRQQSAKLTSNMLQTIQCLNHLADSMTALKDAESEQAAAGAAAGTHIKDSGVWRLRFKAARVLLEAATIQMERCNSADAPSSLPWSSKLFDVLQMVGVVIGVPRNPRTRAMASGLLSVKGELCFRLALPMSRGGMSIGSDQDAQGEAASASGQPDQWSVDLGAVTKRFVDSMEEDKDEAELKLSQTLKAPAEGTVREELLREAIQVYYQALAWGEPGESRNQLHRHLGSVYNEMAQLRLSSQRFTKAMEEWKQGIFHFKEAHDPVNEALVHCNVGRALMSRAQHERHQMERGEVPSSPATTDTDVWSLGRCKLLNAPVYAPVDECMSLRSAFTSFARSSAALKQAEKDGPHVETPQEQRQGQGQGQRPGQDERRRKQKGARAAVGQTEAAEGLAEERKKHKRDLAMAKRVLDVALGQAHSMFALRVLQFGGEAWEEEGLAAAVREVNTTSLVEMGGPANMNDRIDRLAPRKDVVVGTVYHHLRRALSLFHGAQDAQSVAATQFFAALMSLRCLGSGSARPGLRKEKNLSTAAGPPPHAGGAGEWEWHERAAEEMLGKAGAYFQQRDAPTDAIRIAMAQCSSLVLQARGWEKEGKSPVRCLISAMSKLLKGVRQAAKRAHRAEVEGRQPQGDAIGRTLLSLTGVAVETTESVWKSCLDATLHLFPLIIKALDSDVTAAKYGAQERLKESKRLFLACMKVPRGVSVAQHLTSIEAEWSDAVAG